jgi:hypothetical protein
MNIRTKLVASAVASAIVIGTSAYGAFAESASTRVFKPGRGVSLDVGAKRVAGYYTVGDTVCDLTLMFADRADADGHVSGAATRMNVPVKVGARQRIYTVDGNALEASCSLSAGVMTLRPLDLTASVAK